MMTRERSRLRDRSGVAIALVALILFVILGVTALAVDLGMLMGARTEAQRVADSGALAGATALTGALNDEAVARDMAIDYAHRNKIRNVSAEVLPEDVDVEQDDWLVRVRVFRTAERGSALANLFARAIGIPTSDVSATAAARWVYGVGASCLLPFVVPDQWWIPGTPDTVPNPVPETGGPPWGHYPAWGDTWNETRGDKYRQWAEFDVDGNMTAGPFSPHTGYTEASRGTRIRLRSSGGGGGDWSPAIYLPYRIPGDQGADDYRDYIKGCPQPDAIHYPGMVVSPEPGAMTGPTFQGFEALYALAPNHKWVESGANVPPGGCVWDPERTGGAGCIPDFQSPRTRTLPLADPTNFPSNPSAEFEITNFAGVFYEGRQGNEIIVRFVRYRAAKAIAPESGVRTMGMLLQLVE